MIRVLQILQGGSSFGGVENFLYQYYKHMDHDKVHFDFLFISDDSMSEKWKEDLFRDSEHITLGLNVRDIKGIQKAVQEFFKTHTNYDCVHINTGNITIQYPCLVAAKRAGIRCRIAHSHSTGRNGQGSWIKKKITRYLQNKIRQNSTVMAGCSYEAAQHIFGDNVDENLITIIPNAIDTSLYRSDKEDIQKIKDEFDLNGIKTFVQVGNFYPVKNHAFSIDVFNELNAVFSEWKLIFLGKGELAQDSKKKVDELGLSEKIIFAGFRNDVPQILQAADCLVVPSLWEGFPLCALEGQAAGLSVICSETVPHAVDVTGNCRFLPLKISEWVEACLNNKEGTSAQLKQVIEAGFDIKDAAEKLTHLYARF